MINHHAFTQFVFDNDAVYFAVNFRFIRWAGTSSRTKKERDGGNIAYSRDYQVGTQGVTNREEEKWIESKEKDGDRKES